MLLIGDYTKKLRRRKIIITNYIIFSSFHPLPPNSLTSVCGWNSCLMWKKLKKMICEEKTSHSCFQIENSFEICSSWSRHIISIFVQKKSSGKSRNWRKKKLKTSINSKKENKEIYQLPPFNNVRNPPNIPYPHVNY